MAWKEAEKREEQVTPEEIWSRVLKEPQAEVEFPIVELVIRAHRDIGRDFHGNTLHAERVSWVDRHGFTDEGTREAVLELLSECNAVEREVRSNKDEATGDDLEGLVN